MEHERQEWRDDFQSEAHMDQMDYLKLKPLPSFLEPLTAQFNYYIWNIH